jgi:hypothetical protein
MELKSVKIIKNTKETNTGSSYFMMTTINRQNMKLVEKELESIHLIQYLDSIVEEDEEVITIDLRKKTLKKLLRYYNEKENDIIKEAPNQETKTNKETKEMNENIEEKDDNKPDFTEKQKIDLFENFKKQLNTKETSINFEIDQLINDVYSQLSHNSIQTFQHYTKYVSIKNIIYQMNSIVKSKDRDYSILMIRSIANKMINLIEDKYNEFEKNSVKLKILKEKFNIVDLKQRIDLPPNIIIDPIGKKKKLDLNSFFDIGINIMNQVFSEVYSLFYLLIKFGEQLDCIFALLLNKLDSNFSIKNLIGSTFYNIINSERCLKYCLIVIKHKCLKMEDSLFIEKNFKDSHNHLPKLLNFINDELKAMFEKILLNSQQPRILNDPITPDNSETVSEEDKNASFSISEPNRKYDNQCENSKTDEIKLIRKQKQNEHKQSEDNNPDLEDLVNYINTEENDKNDKNSYKDKKIKKKVNNPRKLRTQSESVIQTNPNYDELDNNLSNYQDKDRKSFVMEDKKNKKRFKDDLTTEEANFNYFNNDKCNLLLKSSKKKLKLSTEESTNIEEEEDEEDNQTVKKFGLILSNQSVHSAFTLKLRVENLYDN